MALPGKSVFQLGLLKLCGGRQNQRPAPGFAFSVSSAKRRPNQ
jgi:hypothetical protein